MSTTRTTLKRAKLADELLAAITALQAATLAYGRVVDVVPGRESGPLWRTMDEAERNVLRLLAEVSA